MARERTVTIEGTTWKLIDGHASWSDAWERLSEFVEAGYFTTRHYRGLFNHTDYIYVGASRDAN